MKSESHMYCKFCGRKIDECSSFCQFCGTKIQRQENLREWETFEMVESIVAADVSCAIRKKKRIRVKIAIGIIIGLMLLVLVGFLVIHLTQGGMRKGDTDSNLFFNGLTIGYDGEYYGFINKDFKFVIEPQYEGVTGWAPNGLCGVRIDGKWGYIDENGDLSIVPQFDYAEPFADNRTAKITNYTYNEYGWREIEGYALINLDGDIIDEADDDFYTYQFAENGLAWREGGVYINSKGETVIDIECDESYPFDQDGFALVRNGEKIRYIDKSGKAKQEVSIDGLESAEPFGEEGFVVVQVDDKYGIIDREGKYIIKPKYDNYNLYYKKFENYWAPPFDQGITLESDKEEIVIDSKGEVVHKEDRENSIFAWSELNNFGLICRDDILCLVNLNNDKVEKELFDFNSETDYWGAYLLDSEDGYTVIRVWGEERLKHYIIIKDRNIVFDSDYVI